MRRSGVGTHVLKGFDYNSIRAQCGQTRCPSEQERREIHLDKVIEDFIHALRNLAPHGRDIDVYDLKRDL